MSDINTPSVTFAPIICDFGWYYGSPPRRRGDTVYTIGTTQYPPGYTTVNTGGVALPSATIPTSITVLSKLQSLFLAAGTIRLDNTTGTVATVQYTGLGTLSGSSSSGVQGFTGCTTTSSAIFAAGNQIYDPRYYVDAAPTNQTVTFDTADTHNLGIPTTVIPSGINVINYQWDFGNGLTSNGPQASTTYNYTTSPNFVAKLTIVDNMGRRYSCSHVVNLQPALTGLFVRSFSY